MLDGFHTSAHDVAATTCPPLLSVNPNICLRLHRKRLSKCENDVGHIQRVQHESVQLLNPHGTFLAFRWVARFHALLVITRCRADHGWLA